jgi:tetratricopeptide (TPR) repeat protein
MPQSSPTTKIHLRASIGALLLNIACSNFVLADQDAYGRSAALPYYNRANRYLNQARYEEAARDLEEAINRYPNDPDFHTNLGVAYRKLERYADAEREFKTAIAFDRDDWMNWSNLANAYLKQNMLEKTVVTFQEALKHHPPDGDAAAINRDIADIKKVLAGTNKKPPSNQPLSSGSSKVTKIRVQTLPARTSGTTPKEHSEQTPAQRVGTLVGNSAGTSNSNSPTQSTSKNVDWGYDFPQTGSKVSSGNK